ncbi:TM2 domain-containing protein [Cryobacterium sp. TmT2-59]|uniref:TM2 domain-containing protein n=1 Tax=Cryobacterium sp. TmT2-59 TaxID=1259264 RepID=UPI001069D2A7|nr:TM2 domain-containing protein [Cryobacterium sp. TmT2-59]TFC88481.1 TM2 domain-containing protein [Cryobacterium sp. TmT2-59]
MTEQYLPQPYPPVTPGYSPPPKSFVATWLFAWLLGFLAIDRFYLGKVGTGLLKLLTVGGFGLWWLIDLILVLAGAQRDKHGRPLAGYAETVAWIVTAAGFVLSMLSSGLASSLNS